MAKLYFREKGIPKEIKKRIGILAVIFIIFLVFFQILLNRRPPEKHVTMAEATLPLVTVESYGKTMGELHGYINEMDACYMRDALIPLDSQRKMTLQIDTLGYSVKDTSYEIRSLDTQRKIADTGISDWETQGDIMSATVQVENLVEVGEEYLFILTLQGEEQQLHYYTRIMLPPNSDMKKCLAFAQNFHNTALSENYQDLASYVETSPYCDTETLANVGIDSSLDQIGWKGFTGKILKEPLIQLTDMNDDYISLVYYYLMTDEQDGVTAYFNVKEYFKIRYTPEQIYLLDYQRTMEQLLNTDSATVKDNILTLGVATSDVEYLSNETGTIVSFVQGGELFEYNQNKQTFTKVFGFIDDPTDHRQNYQQHNIRILNIDETGNMDFVVYGYMNRGEHEGDCGINLYHYNSAKQEAVEQVFISSTHSYQILNANFSNLLYENVQGDFYIMLGGTLAKVGLNDLTTQELIKGLHSGQYAVSQSGQFVAWIDSGEMADEISIMDLETEKVRKIKAENGTKIKPLAFMTEDFVYGIAATSDITKDAAGSDIYPMSHVKIVDTKSKNFDTLKDYQKSGYYVTEVSKESFTLYLDRVQKSNGTFVPAEGDTIKDSAGEQNKTVDLAKKSTKNMGSVTQFVLAELEEGSSINAFSGEIAGLAVTAQTRSMSVSASQQEQTFFVYVGNQVTLTTQNLTKAINAADEEMGIVIDNQQRYVWKRGKKTYINAFLDVEVGASDASANTSAGAISAMLVRKGENTEVHALLDRGETPVSIIQKALKDDLVLDLSGCTLSQVLYYVSHNAPVYARTGPTDALLIIGYDATSIVVYHSDTDRYSRISMEEAVKLFENAGNIFISYVE
ncbi:MAG: hypothetical protein PUB19_06420 [Lachnospiraceae bacterium]|nr:hypothetical protein [Lachnospiraceae bacterium]